MGAPRNPDRAAEALTIAARAAAATAGVLSVVLAAFLLWRAEALLVLLYVAAMLAIVLDRPVSALQRRRFGRAWALACVLGGLAAVAAAAVVVAVGPLVDQVRELAASAPAVVERLRAALAGRFAGILGGGPLTTWIHEALSVGAGALASGVRGAAGGAAIAAGDLVTVLVLAVILLAAGPRLVRRSIDALSPPRRAQAEALTRELSISLGGYLAGLGTIVVARSIATGAFLAFVRVPFGIPLALLAGVSVLIPYAGSALRLVAIGAVAWAARGTTAAVASLAFVATYDLVENYALSPIVYRKTVGISGLEQLAAVLVLGYLFGVVGAVLAIPLDATVRSVVRALASPAAPAEAPAGRVEERREGTSAAREAPAGRRSGD